MNCSKSKLFHPTCQAQRQWVWCSFKFQNARCAIAMQRVCASCVMLAKVDTHVRTELWTTQTYVNMTQFKVRKAERSSISSAVLYIFRNRLFCVTCYTNSMKHNALKESQWSKKISFKNLFVLVFLLETNSQAKQRPTPEVYTEHMFPSDSGVKTQNVWKNTILLKKPF